MAQMNYVQVQVQKVKRLHLSETEIIDICSWQHFMHAFLPPNVKLPSVELSM